LTTDNTQPRGPFQQALDRINGNAVLVMVARIGMALSLPVLGAMAASQASREDDLQTVKGRVQVIETLATVSRNDQDKFQDSMITSINGIQRQQVEILERLATITSRLDTQDRISARWN